MKLASILGRLWKQRQLSRGRSTDQFFGSSDPLGEWILPWCRLLNAFPEVEDILAFHEAVREQSETLLGRWIHISDRGRAGYILAEQVGGRYSVNLPAGIRPEDVLELKLDTQGRTPAKNRLNSHIANVELTIDAGRDTCAARLLGPARQLIDWPQSVRACDDRIEAIVTDGLRRISPLQRSNKLSPGALALQAASLVELLNTLAKDAETCYCRFVAVEPMLSIDSSPLANDFWNRFPPFAVNGPMYADLLILRGICLAIIQTAETPAAEQGTFLDETLLALSYVMKEREPGTRARGMATTAVIQAIKQGRENDLRTVIDSLQDEGEKNISSALELTSTDHGLFFDLLYVAAPPLRAALEITQFVDEAHKMNSKVGTPSFRSFAKKARHTIEEKMVRLSDSLTSDAEDIIGSSFAHCRKKVLDKLASEGTAAAALEAAHFTTHSLLYPRSLEPYLLGKRDNLNWKSTWNLPK